MGTRNVSWRDFTTAANELVARVANLSPTGVYGIPRGGAPVAAYVAGATGLNLLDSTLPGCVVVDDLVDSGNTAAAFADYNFDALYRKSYSPAHLAPAAIDVGDAWLVFPWEASSESQGPADSVVRMLEAIGEDPTRDGLLDTPARVVKAWREMTAGYACDPADILARTFEVEADEMVVVRRVNFTSLCEHHVLPFTGYATVAYVPAEGGPVVGLSKLARLVDCFAMRLQVQERLTSQIVEAIDDHLKPRGAGCVIAAHHHCMGCRGVRKPEAEMVTSALRGLLKDDPRARAEFLSFAR